MKPLSCIMKHAARHSEYFRAVAIFQEIIKTKLSIVTRKARLTDKNLMEDNKAKIET